MNIEALEQHVRTYFEQTGENFDHQSASYSIHSMMKEMIHCYHLYSGLQKFGQGVRESFWAFI